jgi:hypothetical protein
VDKHDTLGFCLAGSLFPEALCTIDGKKRLNLITSNLIRSYYAPSILRQYQGLQKHLQFQHQAQLLFCFNAPNVQLVPQHRYSILSTRL